MIPAPRPLLGGRGGYEPMLSLALPLILMRLPAQPLQHLASYGTGDGSRDDIQTPRSNEWPFYPNGDGKGGHSKAWSSSAAGGIKRMAPELDILRPHPHPEGDWRRRQS